MLNKHLIPAPWTQRVVPGGKFVAKLGPELQGRPQTETAHREAPLWGVGWRVRDLRESGHSGLFHEAADPAPFPV